LPESFIFHPFFVYLWGYEKNRYHTEFAVPGLDARGAGAYARLTHVRWGFSFMLNHGLTTNYYDLGLYLIAQF